MLEEGIGDVEDVIAELGVAAWPMRQHAGELVVRDLREEPLRRRLDRDEPRGQLGCRQHLRPAPRDPCDACHLAQHLAVRPILTAPHDRNRADAQRRQLGKGILVLKHVDRDEGNAVLGEELLHSETTGAAGLPVCLDNGRFRR